MELTDFDSIDWGNPPFDIEIAKPIIEISEVINKILIERKVHPDYTLDEWNLGIKSERVKILDELKDKFILDLYDLLYAYKIISNLPFDSF